MYNGGGILSTIFAIARSFFMWYAGCETAAKPNSRSHL